MQVGKKIKFLPQTRNGKTVLVSRVVKSHKAFPSYCCEDKEFDNASKTNGYQISLRS